MNKRANRYSSLSRCACLAGAAFQAEGRKAGALALYPASRFRETLFR